jgi:hypothetical protein
MNDLSQKRELSESAGELTDSKAFQQALLDLRKHWFNELMTAADGTERKLELIAHIKALEIIPAQLKIYIADYKSALKQQKHG